MAIFNKTKDSGAAQTSFFGKTVEMTGQLVSVGEMRLEGELKGEVFAEKLGLTDTAKVEGRISCLELTTDGLIKGNTQVKTHTSMMANSKVLGNIKTSSITIDKGALIDGFIEIYTPEQNVLDIPQPVTVSHAPIPSSTPET